MENDELLYILFRYEFVTQTARKHYDNLTKKGNEVIKAIDDYRSSK